MTRTWINVSLSQSQQCWVVRGEGRSIFVALTLAHIHHYLGSSVDNGFYRPYPVKYWGHVKSIDLFRKLECGYMKQWQELTGLTLAAKQPHANHRHWRQMCVQNLLRWRTERSDKTQQLPEDNRKIARLEHDSICNTRNKSPARNELC